MNAFIFSFKRMTATFSLVAGLFLPAFFSYAAAGAATDLDQCQNGSFLNLNVPCRNTPAPKWVNGDLNASNSQYREGDGIPYRLNVTGLADGDWVMRIQYDFSQGGEYALDRLTSYRLTQNSNPCAGHLTTLCDGTVPELTIPMPGEVATPLAGMPSLPKGGALVIAGTAGALSANDTRMAVWERTNTGTVSLVKIDSNVTQIGLSNGNSTRDFAFTLQVSNCPASGCALVLGWTGHVAAEADWGKGEGASSISGAPFHMRVLGVDQTDGTSGGNQDRSVQTGAIVPPPGDASCENFSSASYTITNNGGSSSFLIGTPIDTNLSLKVKNAIADSGGNADIVLVMDRSSSMDKKESLIAPQTKLQVAKTALLTAVDLIAKSGNPNNRIALVTFSGTVTLDQPLTNDYNAVKVAINNIVSSSGTSIGGGLLGAASELQNNSTNPLTRRFIILASDGLQNTAPSVNTGIAAVSSDTTVYTVGIGTDADAASLQKIAATAGAANGAYFFSDISNLAAIFQNIAERILGAFSIQDIKFAFTRDDTSSTDLTGALPAYDSYDKTNGIIRWDSLGSMVNGESKDIAIYYTGQKIGNNIPLNTDSLLVNYSISGNICSETVPVNVLFIDILNPTPPAPSCTDVVWNPPVNNVCTTQTVIQTSNCGTTRLAAGVKICAQCSDSIDNDIDGFIDYPSDRGCYSPLDNNEKNYNFHFLEF
jgi:uncharacterized protein YegL